ncbi:MAG: HD-GYP domain-containing protein [Clostridia bacterium]|nr:HD-GYP domain-containing protein [Clostridia bacterium]
MIKFVSVDRVKPGVTLAKDIYGVDTFTGKIVMLKVGQKLTMAHITKLMGLDLQGIYINEPPVASELLTGDTKTELFHLIDELEATGTPAFLSLYKEKIEDASSILNDFVDTILRRDDLRLSMENLDFHENLRYAHTVSTAVISIVIAKELGMSKSDILDLTLAALIHDIGDKKLPDGLLDKPARLTEDEYEIVKTHTTHGYGILGHEDFSAISEPVKSGVLSHHERFDGSGYPNGLGGEEIPLFARIIAVADVYSALTADRPYRSAYQVSEAIEYIMGNADRQFDAIVVAAFLKIISPYPIGSCVRLSSGERAVVSKQNPENPLRPVVFLMDDPTAVIDLYHDKCFYNVVVTALLDE